MSRAFLAGDLSPEDLAWVCEIVGVLRANNPSTSDVSEAVGADPECLDMSDCAGDIRAALERA